jgi:hypothetical protein
MCPHTTTTYVSSYYYDICGLIHYTLILLYTICTAAMPLALENSWEHAAYAVDRAATAAYEATFSAVEATISAVEAVLGLGMASYAGKAQTQPAAGTQFTQFTCFF